MFSIPKTKGNIEIWIKRQRMQITKKVKIIKAAKKTWINKSQAQSKIRKSVETSRKQKSLGIQNQQSSKFNPCKIIKSQNSYLPSLTIYRVSVETICYLMRTTSIPILTVFKCKIIISKYLRFWKIWRWRSGKTVGILSKENLRLIVL